MKDRFAAARAAGFNQVEMHSPYDFSIQDLERALIQNHLHLCMIATPMGDWSAGERGFMGVPRRIADFRRGFEKALEYAEALDVNMIHLMAGIADITRAQKMLTRNLAWAAYNAPDRQLVLGPLGQTDVTGYAIEGFDHALELMDWIGAPNLGLHFDINHARDAVQNIQTAWVKYGPRTLHIELLGATQASSSAKSLIEAVRADGFEGVISAPNP